MYLDRHNYKIYEIKKEVELITVLIKGTLYKISIKDGTDERIVIELIK